ncbi:PIH1 domain-containing protein 2 [Polymixia lowei]
MMSSVGCPKDVLQQVDHLWSILDDLSENDPKAYQSFIEKQMREGVELSAPPQPDSCLRTEILGPKEGLLFINICGWKRVPAPQDPSKPIPMCGGKLETDIGDGGDWYSVLDVALSPAVLHEAKKDKREMDQVYLLALSFTHQQHGLRLSQQYTVTSSILKGSLDDMQRRIGFKKHLNSSATSTKQPDTATQTPNSLLQQISSLRAQQSEEDSAAQHIFGPSEHKKKNLIQVISSTFTAQPRKKPEYQLKVNTDPEGVSRSVELTVELPKVRSMSECHLSISQDDVLLEVEDKYHLLLELPEIVNEDSASATFNKKKRRLTLTVTVL